MHCTGRLSCICFVSDSTILARMFGPDFNVILLPPTFNSLNHSTHIDHARLQEAPAPLP